MEPAIRSAPFPRLPAARAGQAVRAILSPGRVAVLITLLGGLLRLYRVTALDLWVDEGLTVQFARLPWPTVLGLHGAYETHPPLYFALVKAVSLVAPELVAGRLLSVLAGTATIPLVYALGSRLIHPWAGVVMSAVLALSPLHIWYSQEARPYALVVGLVGLSYLALALFTHDPRRRWAVLYGVSVFLALYTEYSAVYALLLQVMVLAHLTRVQGRRASAVWAAGALAALGFLPWVPQLLTTVEQASAQWAGYLSVTPDKVGTSILSVMGLAGAGSYFGSHELTPWERWPAWQGAMLLLLVVAGGGGVLALTRRAALAILVAASLLLGTVAIAVWISVVRPGYAERTILAAVLGWAVLLGAVPFGRGPGGLRWAGVGSLVGVLALSLVSVGSIYGGGEKQHWSELAAATARAARLGSPALTYPTVSGTLLDLYATRPPGAHYIAISDWSGPPPEAAPGANPGGGLWLAYVDGVGGLAELQQQIGALGYTRILHQYVPHPLYLDLYILPGARLGREVPVNGTFAGDDGHVTGWQVPPQGVAFQPGSGAARELTFTNGGARELQATTTIPAQPGGFYLLSFEARAQWHSGRVRSFLICAGTGGWTRIAPDEQGATVPDDGAWHTVSISVECPAASTSLILDLRNAGTGATTFRNVRLQDLDGTK
jgi:hypothetical protein